MIALLANPLIRHASAGLLLAVAVGFAFWRISDHYYERGRDDAVAVQQAALVSQLSSQLLRIEAQQSINAATLETVRAAAGSSASAIRTIRASLEQFQPYDYSQSFQSDPCLLEPLSPGLRANIAASRAAE